MKNSFIAATAVKSLLMVAALFPFAGITTTTLALSRGHADSLSAELFSLSQAPAVPARSHGSFSARVNEDRTIPYKLSYAEMSSPATHM